VHVCIYQALIWGEEDSDAGVDLADGERNKHPVDFVLGYYIMTGNF